MLTLTTHQKEDADDESTLQIQISDIYYVIITRFLQLIMQSAPNRRLIRAKSAQW